MLVHPSFDPIAFSLGPVDIHWYGLLYFAAFVMCWATMRYRARHYALDWTPAEIDDLIFYIAIGCVVGGRVGFMLFYAPRQLIADPLSLFYVWQGGMSFHGGLVGTLAATWLHCRRPRWQRDFFRAVDFFAVAMPLAIMAGRWGNFINAEHWGTASSLPWAMVFPQVDSVPRHPSQIYQILGEGLLVFILLYLYSRKPRPRLAVSALFAFLVGSLRFAVEFVREPDAHIGYLAGGWLTLGQVLTLPLILLGALLWLYSRRQPLEPRLGG